MSCGVSHVMVAAQSFRWTYGVGTGILLAVRALLGVGTGMKRLTNTSRLLLITAAVVIAASGCGRRNDVVQSSGPEELYERGTNSMSSGNYPTALAHYQQLEARYPFSNVTRQAQLDMIYVYYKARQPESAIDAAEEFERENPTHPRVDYCLYMKGLIYFDAAPNFLEKLFRVDMSERPPRDTLQAFTTFQELIRRYPDSEYVPDARERMIFLRNRLAEYENFVAEYYIRRGAYVAAINRGKFALEHYPGAPAIQESLQLMAQAYSLLGMPDLAADTRRVIEVNYGIEPPPIPENQVEVLEVEVADAAPPTGETEPEG